MIKLNLNLDDKSPSLNIVNKGGKHFLIEVKVTTSLFASLFAENESVIIEACEVLDPKTSMFLELHSIENITIGNCYDGLIQHIYTLCLAFNIVEKGEFIKISILRGQVSSPRLINQ